MPGCRKLDLPTIPYARHGRVDLPVSIRHRGRPPRPANDNRRVPASRFWHWAILIGLTPAIGILAAFSTLF